MRFIFSCRSGSRSWALALLAATACAPWHLQAAPETARINAGGARYVDKAAQLWSKDFGFSSGHKTVSKSAVKGTRLDPLYASQRTASSKIRYEIPLKKGQYTVTLHFAEMDAKVKRKGKRQFDVVLEGRKVLSKFDMFAQKGQYEAISRTFSSNVSDGKLSVRLSGVRGKPVISAIEAVRSKTADNNTNSTSSADVDLKLSWDAVDGDIISYYVYFGRNRNSVNRLASKINVRWNRRLARNPQVAYNGVRDLGLRAGDPICFRIITRAISGKSKPSEALCTRV